MSRGACICSSASRSRRRFPTAAAARPVPALPIARWRTCSIVAAPRGSRTPAAHYSVACTSGRVVHFPYRCGTLRLTDRDAHRATPPAAAERPRPIIAWRAPQVGRFIFPIVAAPFGRPTAMSTQWAAPFGTQTPAAYNNVALGLIYNGVSSRSLRHPSAADRDFHSVGGALRHADARGGFRPANAARTPPHFFPTCDAQEANLFI